MHHCTVFNPSLACNQVHLQVPQTALRSEEQQGQRSCSAVSARSHRQDSISTVDEMQAAPLDICISVIGPKPGTALLMSVPEGLASASAATSAQALHRAAGCLVEECRLCSEPHMAGLAYMPALGCTQRRTTPGT